MTCVPVCACVPFCVRICLWVVLSSDPWCISCLSASALTTWQMPFTSCVIASSQMLFIDFSEYDMDVQNANLSLYVSEGLFCVYADIKNRFSPMEITMRMTRKRTRSGKR